MTRTEYQKLKSELLETGYQRHMNHNDIEAAAESECPECGSDEMYCEGFKQPGRHGEYHCYAVCRHCGDAYEF